MIEFFLNAVSRYFKAEQPLCREDAIRKIDMEPDVDEKVKTFWHQLQFDDVVKTSKGELRFDSGQGMYSDA